MTTHGKVRAFTLLELLAAVTLLVVLGTMLFQIFSQASRVTQIGSGRQEIFQYARSVLVSIEHELVGAINQRDASQTVVNNGQGKPFRVFHTPGALTAFNTMMTVPARPGSDALSLTAAIVGRDTVSGSPTFGQVANNARLAYWLNPNNNASHEAWALNRYESYDITNSYNGVGWEVAVNVLKFQIECLDQYHNPPAFAKMDWDSVDAVNGERRGLPMGVAVTLKITDTAHINCWQFNTGTNASELKADKTPDDDPIMQQFRQVIRTRETQE